MNPVPSPSPIDIILHTGDDEWWQIVAALGPFVVLLVAVIGWLTLRRRTVAHPGLTHEISAGIQTEWWPRARWALEATLDDKPERQEVGLAALELLNASSLSGKEETKIIAEAWKRPLHDSRTISHLAEKEWVGKANSQSRISHEERVIVRAARLRLSTDKKQGIESPSWVKEVAEQPL